MFVLPLASGFAKPEFWPLVSRACRGSARALPISGRVHRSLNLPHIAVNCRPMGVTVQVQVAVIARRLRRDNLDTISASAGPKDFRASAGLPRFARNNTLPQL